MRSFKIYLPGGREPTTAGRIVISSGIIAMGVSIYHFEELAYRLPKLNPAQAQALVIILALAIITVGWGILKIFRIPFSKPCRKEEFRFNEENEK